MSETRVRVAWMRDAGEAHPAEIEYVAEARVSYTYGEHPYTQWLRASKVTADRGWLEGQLALRRLGKAEVRVNSRDATKGFVRLP